jgi:hypothetical protein
MSTKRSAGPRVPAQETRRSAASRKKNRSTNLCAFTFADGRQCRTPRCSGHLHLCYFHAQKEAERLAAKQVGEDISRFLPAKLLTACDLSGAMARVFCAIARGDVKPKLASTLAYLSQSMVQSVPIAQHEYCEAFGTDSWRREIRASFNVPAPQPKPASQPAPKPAPQPPASASATPTPVEAGRNLSRPGREPGSSASSSSTSSPAPQPPENCHSERSEEPASSSNSPLATHHSPLPQSPQPAPSPHTPLPTTIAEFAQQVLAGRNSSRAEVPTPSGPGRENGSSGSSFSSTSTTPPQPRVNCHSERSEEPASSSNSSLATHHSPLPQPAQPAPTPSAPQPTSPQQSQPTQNSHHNSQPAPASPAAPPPVPPGFGAPANWDVLIPPKPRRRFSRHWHLHE